MASTQKNILLVEEFFFRRFVSGKVNWLLSQMPNLRKVQYYMPFIYYDCCPTSEDFARAGYPEVEVQCINTTLGSGTIELLRNHTEFEVPTIIVYKEEEETIGEERT